MNLAKLVARIEADARPFNSALKTLGRTSDRMLDRIRDKVRAVNKDLKQGFAVGAGAAITARALSLVDNALSMVVNGISGAIAAGSNLRESMSLSGQVFEKNADMMLRWAKGAAKAFGQSTREALDFASGFGTTFKNVGVDIDQVADKSQKLTRLAADLGSAFNKSSEEAATALRSGLIGESEPLRAFGVFLSEAAVGAKALKMGIASVGKPLTNTQKVLARYAIIMEQTKDSQGMFGRDTFSLADAQKRLGAQVENLAAKFGTVLVPTALKATEAVSGLVTIVEQLADSIVGRAVGALGDLAGGLHGISPASDKLVQDFYAAQAAQEAYAASTAALYARLETNRSANFAAATKFAEPIPGAMKSAGEMARRILDSSIDRLVSLLATRRNDFVDAATGVANATWDPQINKAELTLVNIALRDKDLLERLGSTKAKVRAEAKIEYANLLKDQARLRAAVQADRTQGQAELAQALLVRNRANAAANATMLMDTGAMAKSNATQVAEQFERSQGRTYAAAVALGDKAAAGLRAGFGKVILKANINVASTGTGQIGDGGRAAGGPVKAGGLYRVGERGEEWFAPNVSGMIVPNHDVRNIERSSSTRDGGDTYQVTVNNPEPRAAAPDIGRVLQRIGGLGMTGDPGWAPS